MDLSHYEYPVSSCFGSWEATCGPVMCWPLGPGQALLALELPQGPGW